MDIYLSEVANKSSSFTFPSLPERIQVKSNTSYQNYDIIGKGNVKIPKGMENGTISWSAQFFGRAKRKESIVRHFSEPSACKTILAKWMENGTVLRLLVTETNINMDVTISEFSYEEYGAHGNAEYDISFSRYLPLQVYTTDELKIAAFVKTIVTRAEPAPSTNRSYTVVQGDNLWKIARKFYGGSGSNWKILYDANVDVIESTARRYGKSNSNTGWWIYPGEVFTIP